MTDRELAGWLALMKDLEQATRAYARTEDMAERDHVVNVVRLVVPLRRSIETWIGLRALRAQLCEPSSQRVSTPISPTDPSQPDRSGRLTLTRSNETVTGEHYGR